MLAYPDIPNHQSYVPNYAKAKAALQAFRNKVPDHGGPGHRCRARDAADDPPGHLRRAAPTRPLPPSTPSGAPARGGPSLHTCGAARPSMSRVDRRQALSRHAVARRARWRVTSSTPRGDLGLRLHRPVAHRARAVHGRADHRLAGPVADRLRPASARRQIQFIGHRQLRRGCRPTRSSLQALARRPFKFALIVIPADDGRQPRPRAAREQPEAVRAQRLPDARSTCRSRSRSSPARWCGSAS